MSIRRYDEFRIDAFKRTPGGGLKVEGNLTRTGIFTYTNADGTTRREYRPDSSVFAEDALESLSDAPVTVGHPSGGVDSESWKRLSVGHTGSAVRKDHLVVAPVIVQDAAVIAQIEARQLTELSCGYEIDYLPTPGVTAEGERYDGVQTNIRGNHVALLAPGKARGGSECSLRLDSDDNEVFVGSGKIVSMTPEQLAALQAELTSTKARADKAESDLKAAVSRADQADGKVGILTAQLATASDPKRFDAAVTERVELLDQARADGVTVPVGSTPRAVRLLVIAKRTPNFRADSLSDESVSSAYALLMAMPHPTLAQPFVRADASNDDVLGAARDKMLSDLSKLSEKK